MDFPRRLLAGLCARLAPTQWQVVAYNTWRDRLHDADLLVQALEAGHFAALIVTQQRNAESERVAVTAARKYHVPVLGVGRRVPGAVAVMADNHVGMSALLDHVLADGKARRPVFLRGNPGSPDAEEREDAFVQGLRRHDIPLCAARVLDSGFDRDPAFRALNRCLQDGFRPDAVVAGNDEAALGALDAVALAGFRVPQDLSVTGFDDSPIAELIGLTSIDQDLPAQGRAVAEALLGTGRRDVVVVSAARLRRSTGVECAESGVRPLPHRDRLAQVHDLHRVLTTCSSVAEVIDVLPAWLPRLGIDRFALVLRLPGPTSGEALARVALLCSGDVVQTHSSAPFPERLLLPPALEDAFPQAVAVRTLVGPSGCHGLMVHGIEQDEQDRTVTAALQVALGQVVDTLQREQELTHRAEALGRHAERLEELVAERTAALEAEVATRQAAEARLRKANVELERLSSMDEVTQVANRRAFNRFLESAWDRASRDGEPVGLVMCDLDAFKAYNDLYGHLAGDHCLRQVAAALTSSARRSSDLVARYGGEELVLLLPGAGPEATARVAEAAVAAVRALRLEHERGPRGLVTVSAGWAVANPALEDDEQSLIRAADTALYRAKEHGRDRCVGPGR